LFTGHIHLAEHPSGTGGDIEFTGDTATDTDPQVTGAGIELRRSRAGIRDRDAAAAGSCEDRAGDLTEPDRTRAGCRAGRTRHSGDLHGAATALCIETTGDGDEP